jgi:hypothetical protein
MKENPVNQENKVAHRVLAENPQVKKRKGNNMLVAPRSREVKAAAPKVEGKTSKSAKMDFKLR